MKVDKNTTAIDVAYNLSGSLTGFPAVISQLPVGERIGFDTLPTEAEDVEDIGQTWTPDIQGMELTFDLPLYSTLVVQKAPFTTDLKALEAAVTYGNNVLETFYEVNLIDLDWLTSIIAYGNGKFILSYNQRGLAITTDGRNFTYVTTGFSYGITAIRYVGGRWWVGDGGGYVIYSDDDGATWSTRQKVRTGANYSIVDFGYIANSSKKCWIVAGTTNIDVVDSNLASQYSGTVSDPVVSLASRRTDPTTWHCVLGTVSNYRNVPVFGLNSITDDIVSYSVDYRSSGSEYTYGADGETETRAFPSMMETISGITFTTGNNITANFNFTRNTALGVFPATGKVLAMWRGSVEDGVNYYYVLLTNETRDRIAKINTSMNTPVLREIDLPFTARSFAVGNGLILSISTNQLYIQRI